MHVQQGARAREPRAISAASVPLTPVACSRRTPRVWRARRCAGPVGPTCRLEKNRADAQRVQISGRCVARQKHTVISTPAAASSGSTCSGRGSATHTVGVAEVVGEDHDGRQVGERSARRRAAHPWIESLREASARCSKGYACPALRARAITRFLAAERAGSWTGGARSAGAGWKPRGIPR